MQTYFCSALSSKLRHMRLKRKQDASSDSKSSTMEIVVKKKPLQSAVAVVTEHRPISAADFEKYKCEMKVSVTNMANRSFDSDLRLWKFPQHWFLAAHGFKWEFWALLLKTTERFTAGCPSTHSSLSGFTLIPAFYGQILRYWCSSTTTSSESIKMIESSSMVSNVCKFVNNLHGL